MGLIKARKDLIQHRKAAEVAELNISYYSDNIVLLAKMLEQLGSGEDLALVAKNETKPVNPSIMLPSIDGNNIQLCSST